MILEKDRIVYYKQIDGPLQGTIMLDNCTIRASDEQYSIEIINSTRESSMDRYTTTATTTTTATATTTTTDS